MTYIIAGILLLIAVQVYIALSNTMNEKGFASVLLWCFGWMPVGLIVYALICVYGGLLPGYSEGTRAGFLTKISEKGVIFKTWEAQIQVGTGDMAALQAPFAFSIPRNRKDLYQTATANLGEKVNVKYSEWVVMPYVMGESGYEATTIATGGR